MTHTALLPNGFHDLLPEEAEQEAYAIHTLMSRFRAFGYRRVKPPLVEFEETLLSAGPGGSLSKDTFRITDTISHKMMGIRADITPQIARIVSTRLKDAPKPLRLCYANDVLRTRPGQLRRVRQFTQVGCEMVGDEATDIYVETIMIALLGLKDIGIQNITLDFALPGVFDMIEDSPRREDFLKILSQRNQSALEEMDGDLSDVLLALMRAGGAVDDAFPVLEDLKLPEELQRQIEDLKAICVAIRQAAVECGMKDLHITLDAFETKGSGYYKGLAFSFFAANIRGELGRGGHYRVDFAGQADHQSATGFTLYMDTIRQAGISLEQPKKKILPEKTGWKETLNLQKKGFVTVLGESKR